MIVDSTREKLTAGEVVLGCFIRHDPMVAEIAGLAGFDFVVSDGEHGGVSPRAFENVAHGVHVPRVESAADAATGAERHLGRALHSFLEPLR